MRTAIFLCGLFISEAIEKAGHVYVKPSDGTAKVLGVFLCAFILMDVIDFFSKRSKK